MSKRTARLTATAVAMVLGGTALAPVSPAAAAESRNGQCETGEFCYYFNSDNAGSISDFDGSVADYGTEQPSCYDFKGEGNGKGICVKNNAASVWNRSDKTVQVYFNSNYGGQSQAFGAGAKGNLNSSLKNQNASHQFVTGPTGCKTDGTHTKLPTSILVYRASLNRVERVSFNYYVRNVLPNEWITSWPQESLRAGAMAVKNYGWYWALHSTRKTSDGRCFDVYDTTSSQVYRPGSATASTDAAVNATWGTRMTRGGKIMQTHYCSTETACGAWVDGDWMSQYGSRDKANAGWGHTRILKHYYAGITLDS